MTLLIVNMTIDPAVGGGTAVRTLNTARALVDAGVTCRIAVTKRRADVLPAGVDGIEIIELPAILGRFRIPRSGSRAMREAAARSDVMLLVNHWTPINVVAYRAARATGTPYVVSPAGALPVDGRSRTRKRIYNAVYGHKIIRDAAAHMAVTADEARQFGPYGIVASRVTVIPNGMPVLPPGDAVRFRARHGLGDAPVALFLGRLAPIKGPDLLVDAFIHALPVLGDWQLVVAGTDEGMRADLERRVAAGGVADRVDLTGFLDAGERADALAASSLVIIPSRREAMSNVVLEAAAAGRPVLVTDTCGMGDVAEVGGGWVVPPTVPDLARGLQAAASDRDALARAGEAWRRYASERYSWTSVAARYCDLFARVRRSALPS